MITSLNDIKKYTEHDQYTLIYNGHDLSQLFYESRSEGCDPQIKFSGCIVSQLSFRFNINKRPITYTIKTQNLVAGSVDGTISVRTEQILQQHV